MIVSALRRLALGSTLPLAIGLVLSVLALVPQLEHGWAGSDAEPITFVRAGRFTISGSVADLAPGLERSLVVQLRNPGRDPLSVSSLAVSVGRPSRSGCAASNLAVSPFRGPVTVPADGTASTTLAVRLAAGAPNACQGTSFPLTYRGRAGRAVVAGTTLSAVPVLAQLGRDGRVTYGQFGARLTSTATGAPIPGKLVTFSLHGRTLCTARTALDGWARCGSRRSSLHAFWHLTYRVTFAGDATNPGSTALAPFLTVGGRR